MLTLRPAYVLLIILSLFSAAHGQRVFKTVLPPEIEGLRFDTNDIPLNTASASASAEFNFSPNVIFSPDSTRAFVSFPGLDRVMVFDPKSGEVIETLEVGDNPARLTLTPDARYLAVPCLSLKANLPNVTSVQGDEIGSIALINIETLEVRSLELSEVSFSVENNIIFSADSSTGFIASAKTDEILRFDVATLSEISPRLAFDGGTRPISLAMAPDYSFFTVVLVGSSALPQAERPDSIQIVDPDTFQVVRSIVPTPTEVPTQGGTTVEIPHDFLAPNNLSISPDGKWGLIADQENSSVSLVPELAQDHAILINLETGETEEVFTTGGFGGATAVSPSGLFVIVSSVDVTVINPEEKTVLKSGSLLSLYRDSSRPAFSSDSKTAYVASPVRDEISVIDLTTGALRNQIPVALGYEREQPAFPAAPLDIAVSPDGSVLTVLNFNADTIDLLSDSLRLMFPEFLSTDDWFTGVALTNNSETATAEVIAAGVSRTGTRFTDLTATEDPASVRKTTDNGATYNNYTDSVAVLDGLGTLEAGDWLVIGYSERFRGLSVDVTNANDNVSQVAVHFWDGSDWSEVPDLTDTTADEDGATLAMDGSIAFRVPTGWVANTIDGISAYHVRLSFSATLDSSVSVESFGIDVVEYENPKTLTVEPNHQVAFTPVELLEPLVPNEIEGWLDTDSNVLEVTGFYLTGDKDILRLDGAVAATQIHQTYILPEVPVGPEVYSLINLVNPNFVSDSVTLELVNSAGEVVASSEQGLASWFAPKRYIYPPSHLPVTIRGTANNGESFTDFTDRTVVLDGLDTLTNGHWLAVGYSEPFGRLQVDVEEPNASSATVAIQYWNGTSWTNASGLSDTTSVSGATLGQDGTISFQVTGTWEQNTLDGVSAYHARLSVSSVLDSPTSAIIEVGLTAEADAVFPRELLEPDDTYYVVIKSDLGAIAGQRFYNQDYMAALSAIPGDSVTGEAQPLFLPQAVAFGGTDSTINLISLASSAATIRLTFLDDDGVPLAAPVTLQLEPSHKLHERVSELFGLTDRGSAVSGWILVEPDQPGIVGNITIYLFSQRAATALLLQERSATRMVFSHVAEGLGYSTGISLVNVNNSATQTRWSVYDPQGNLVGSREDIIGANSRLIGLLREFFPDLPELLGGFVRVESDLPILGLELFYTEDQELVSAVPAQFLAPQTALPAEPGRVK